RSWAASRRPPRPTTRAGRRSCARPARGSRSETACASRARGRPVRPSATSRVSLAPRGAAMSQQSDAVSHELMRYVAAHTRGDDELLRELKREAAKTGLPSIAIAPEQASFMQLLLRAAGAREVVEVGTLGGYSAISMARALPEGGRVRTIELEAAHADFAERWIARSDVAGRVTVLRGAGVD